MTVHESPLARVALRFTAFTERWLPDAFGFVLAGTLLILVFGLLSGEPLLTPAGEGAHGSLGLVNAWGEGFWSLITFTLQMAMIIIGGYAVASSAPMARVITRLARVPKGPRSAVAFVAAVSMLASYFNWAFSLIFGAILAREVARVVRGADYRALGAMAFLGLGTVWAQGFSGSAALQVASAASSPAQVQAEIRRFGYTEGIIPLTDTIFTWRALVATLLVFVVGVVTAWLLAPRGSAARTAESLGIELRPLVGPGSVHDEDPRERETRRPGDWLEHSPLMTLLIVGLGLVWLVQHFGGGIRSARWTSTP